MGDMDHSVSATEIRNVLDSFQDEEIAHPANVPDTIEGFAHAVVEDGTFYPDCRVTAKISLPLRERITGNRSQDMTAMLCIGMLLGSALERDVPMDSAREDAWRNGEFKLPERAVDTEIDQ